MRRDEAKQRATGFKETAEYFEGRARRARNETEHEHHLDAARFYRELAAIIPGLPDGFTPPQNVNRANRYRNRAVMCRTIADLLTDAARKRKLEYLARTYETLAATREKPQLEYAATARPVRYPRMSP